MSTTQTPATGDVELTTEEPAFRNIGIELEYPLAANADDAPATYGRNSSALRDQYRQSNHHWPVAGFGDESGYMGRDHTGAEITSGILDLTTDEPERWYRASIEEAEQAGHPFAATGQGDTNFGCHYHLSELPDEGADLINEVTNTRWGVVFFTASIMQNSLDPWRHGGVGNVPDNNACRSRRDREGYTDHYEFRLVEPVQVEHFDLIMEFLRLVADGEYEHARDFAYELVMSCDERLTPFKQYQMYKERLDDWPTEACFESEDGRTRTDPEMAVYFYDLVE